MKLKGLTCEFYQIKKTQLKLSKFKGLICELYQIKRIKMVFGKEKKTIDKRINSLEKRLSLLNSLARRD